MYLAVKTVEVIEKYQLLLSFENGEARMLDIAPYLDFGLFQQLKDEALFKTVRISFDTIEWDNQIDLDPEFLYEKSVLVPAKSKVYITSPEQKQQIADSLEQYKAGKLISNEDVEKEITQFLKDKHIDI